jgi:hypothetical protein
MIGITNMTHEDLLTLGWIVKPDLYKQQMEEIDAELALTLTNHVEDDTEVDYEEYVY